MTAVGGDRNCPVARQGLQVWPPGYARLSTVDFVVEDGCYAADDEVTNGSGME